MTSTIETIRKGLITRAELLSAGTIEAWREQWCNVGRDEKDRPWKLGALFNAGRRFIDATKARDEKAVCRLVEKLVPAVGIEMKTVRLYGYVEAAFPADNRSQSLSWQHHREIWLAGVDARQRRKWLERAEKENLSTRDLRVALAQSKGGGERKEKAVRFDTSFVIIRWAGEGEHGLRKIFPEDQPINAPLLEAVRRECGGLVAELKRVGLV